MREIPELFANNRRWAAERTAADYQQAIEDLKTALLAKPGDKEISLRRGTKPGKVAAITAFPFPESCVTVHVPSTAVTVRRTATADAPAGL